MTHTPLALYVHIPWCERKCPYCDFNSHVSDSIPEAQYTQAICDEIASISATTQTSPLVSIFFGGGTPSLFSAQAIGQILSQAERHIGFAENCEITLEANPGSSEQSRFSGYKAAGVNRLSLGVQSFNDEHLKRLGRIHSSQSARTAIEAALNAGFTRLNVDIMYALGEQRTTQAIDDLSTALNYGIDHLSWYQLTIEQNTEYFKRPPKLPSDIITEHIEDAGWSLLSEHGFQRYEVSAYAKANSRSAHNVNYWEFGDYIGVGAGAHGKLSLPSGETLRYSNTRLPKDYLARADDKRGSSTIIEPNDIEAEFMMNALRLVDGVNVAMFERTGGDIEGIQATIRRLSNQKLMYPLESGRIQCTPKGYSLLNSVIEQFI